NSTLPALQDDLILSVIEQLKTQVVTCTKVNQDNKKVNDLLTAELERYRNQERILTTQMNDDNKSTSYAHSVEIDSLKHTLSEHLKEKESLEQNITLLKNDLQKEESQNIDRELALEKEVKELNNIVFKRNQSDQTVHMLTKPQVFYNHATRQALGFQNPSYLKKAQKFKPNMYDGSVIGKSDIVVVPDCEDTLMHAEESRSKMIEKQNDPQMIEKKVITKPVDYAILNQLSTYFNTRFVPQTESSAEQAFWSQYSVQTDEPNLFGTTIVEVPKELPKVSLVNSCLKRLKLYLASFDIVVKERTTATAITEGTWGFEHTKACFRDDIILFVKNLKELFTSFDQCLIDEVTEVQNVFKQMKLAVEQHCVEKTKFQNKMESVLQENDRLLTQALSVEIVNTVVHDYVNFDCLNVDACAHCVTTESELKPDFIKKECYETLLQQYHILETHCISLEVNNQLNTEIFQRDNVSSPESAPTFAELFEINDLKAQVQEKDTVILKLKEKIKSFSGDVKERKVKRKVEEIETLNLELDHKEKVLVTTALKEQLNKLKGKAVLTEAVSLNLIDPALLQVDVAPLVPKLQAVATACFTQNRSIILLRHGKTSENVGKLQPKADIGIFIGYAPTKKAFCIYNRRTRRIVETIHVDFDELTSMASEQSSSGPALQEMTPGTISSRLVQKYSSSTSYVPPSGNEWDLLFQPMFDELLNPPPSVDNQATEVIAPIAEVIPQVDDDSTGSPSSTTVDQDAPSPSKSPTPTEIQSIVILQDVGNDNLDIEVAHMGNDPLLGVPIPEVTYEQSSSTASPQSNVQPNHPMTHHNSKWTKDHPLNYIIGPLSRPIFTRLQLHEQALFCYFDAFLTSVEPKTYKEALT
nr:hypothetical protein [Tanacetum cinerariifolium]